MKKWLIGSWAVIGAVLMISLATAKDPLSSVPIGGLAPNFALSDTKGQQQSLTDYKGKYVVLEWINMGCPFVKKHYDTGNMQSLQTALKGKGVVWLSVCSSKQGKEGYMSGEDWNKAIAEKKIASTAILLDPSGDVGRLYGAKTTPHMYVIDPKGALIYKGAIDDRPSTNKDDVKGAKNYVQDALTLAMGGKPVDISQTPPYGCSVKY